MKSSGDSSSFVNKLIYLFFIAFTSEPLGCMAKSSKTSEKYITDLIQKNNPLVPPEVNVTLDISLYLHQLLKVNEKEQVMTSQVTLEVDWNDHRLTWDNATSPQGMTVAYLPPSKIWTPKLYLANSAVGSGSFSGGNDVMIYPDGHVKWFIRAMLTSSCTIDVTYYPFDQQTCILKIVPEDPIIRLQLHRDINFMRLEEFYLSVEWNVIEVPAYLNVYAVSPNVLQYDITYYVTIRRRTNWVYQVYPSLALALLTLTPSLIPRSKLLEKLALHALTLLGISLVWSDTAATLAATALVTPHIFKFLIPLATINLLHLVLTCILSRWNDTVDKTFKNAGNKICKLLFRRREETAKTVQVDENLIETADSKPKEMAGNSNSKWNILSVMECTISVSVFVGVIILVIHFLTNPPHIGEKVEAHPIVDMYSVRD